MYWNFFTDPHSLKDVGARFMSRMLSHFVQEQHHENVRIGCHIRDTGSAVANGFLSVEGIRVCFIPVGQSKRDSEAQFTTLGQYCCIEIAGNLTIVGNCQIGFRG